MLDNVMLPVDVQKLDRETSRARALDLLAAVGLQGFEHRYQWELSGGMQQRVAISRGLIHNRAMLLMGEPFGALDAMTREGLKAGSSGASGRTSTRRGWTHERAAPSR